MKNTITLASRQWQTITTGAVAAARIENRSVSVVYLDASAAAVLPTSLLGTVTLQPGETLYADMTLANLFPDPGGSVYVHAYCDSDIPGVLSVNHA
jgi:hypothetical protein